MNHAERLAALPLLRNISWEGIVFRYTAGARPANRENMLGARWNPPFRPTICASLERETAIAEFRHNLSLWSPRPSRIDFTLYEVRVAIIGVWDLRKSDRHRSAEHTLELARGDDFSPCRRFGIPAWRDRALLVPSARRENGSNLIIFSDDDPPTYEFEVLSSEALRG